MKPIYSSLFILYLFSSCNKNESSKVEKVTAAFYHWNSESYINEELVKKINNLKVKKIYFKLFEIDYNEAMGNFPYEKNKPNENSFQQLDSVAIVPTVFIKNEIFQYNTEATLDVLADNMVFLVDKYHKGNNKNIFEYSEIQIDCDWTKSTKEKYFYLLKKIKEFSSKKISCTLRLYPYKYPDIMGTPPVDSAMLMCYNLIKPLSNKNKNSILDINELKSYLNEKRSYPVHLDVALPVFYWTQWYQNNRFSGLLNIPSADFASYTKPSKDLWYEVTKDTTYGYDAYLKRGDQIKCEEVAAKTIQEAISIIKNNVSLDKETTISLFHLDESTFNKYSYEEISSFYTSFSK